MNKRVVLVLAMCVCVLCFVGLAVSQPAGGGAGPGGGAGGGGARGGGGMGGGMMRGGFGGINEATARQVLGMTDQQWEPIKPKFEKVRQLTADSRVSISVMSGRRRGADAEAAPADSGPQWFRPSQRAQMSGQELTEGDKAAEALLDLLEKKDSDVKQIQQKVEALRAIRQKAQKDLATAQADLRKALNERQQATLTLMGILD